MHRNELILPRTVEQAVQADVLDRARRRLLDVTTRGIAYTDDEVLIAGLLALHDHHQARADKNAATLATMVGRQFARRFRNTMRALADN